MIDTLSYLVVMVLLLSYSDSARAQLPISWSQNFGNQEKNIIQDVIDIDNQGCLTIGYTQNNSSRNIDLWITRINNAGTVEWTKDFGGTGFERATAATLLDDGNLIIVGYGTLTDGDSDGASKRADGVILKMSPTGAILWHKTYGDLGQDQFSDVVALPSGECLVVGSTSSYINNFDDRVTDGWALRINSSGGAVWNKRYGGSLMDRYSRVLRNADGSFILGGTSNSRDGESATSFGADDVWISKINANGTHIWSKNFGGNENDELNALSASSDGGCIIGATSYSNLPGQNGYGDIWVLKVDVLGNQVWQNVLGGSATDKCRDIQAFEGSGFLMATTTLSSDGDISTNLGGQDAWLTKLSATGTVEWSEVLGGSHNDALNALAISADGSVWLAGYSFSSDGNLSSNMGKQDGWLIRSITESAPMIDLGDDVAICMGLELTLDATDSNCTSCQYLWNDGVTSPERTITVTSSATYSVTATNSAGQTATDMVVITAVNPIDASATLQEVTCAGSATGSISVNATGGTGNYDYVWSDGHSTATNLNLSADTYSLTISDDALCAYIGTYFLDDPTPIVADADIVLPSCTSTNLGSISLVVSGGEPSYSYLWSNGFVTSSISGLIPGQYTVTITDQRNCEHIETYLLSNDVTINLSANIQDISCFGEKDGEIVLSVSGDFPPFSFNWDNNFTSSSLIGLSAGEYTVTVTDAMGCQLISKYEVSEPNQIEIFEEQTNTAMGADIGSLLLNIAGGNPPYDVTWSNGETGIYIDDLGVGIYTATVTDGNECTIVESFEIEIATSTSNLIPKSLIVHPNPNSGVFYVQLPSHLHIDSEVQLYSLNGQAVAFSSNLSNNQLSVEVLDYVPGLYFLSIVDRSHLYQSKVVLH